MKIDESLKKKIPGMSKQQYDPTSIKQDRTSTIHRNLDDDFTSPRPISSLLNYYRKPIYIFERNIYFCRLAPALHPEI